MKKICTVVGARPQFIKLAMVSPVLRKEFHEVLIHTGQHYDYNMSQVFFDQMGIPKPDYNLGISGGTHGQMTGQMLIRLEEVLSAETPDMLLVFGDTNSTLAAALAAVKLRIPVCHVEAGNRLGTLNNPEEMNRIVTDHISSLRLACTASSIRFLEREGIADSAYFVGDPMYDAFQHYSTKLNGSELHELKNFSGDTIALPEEFYYMTCHRQENIDTDEKLDQILQAMEELDSPVIYPVHPRYHALAARLCRENGYSNTIFAQPVGYMCSISLVNRSKKVITDSGGLQREAFFAKKQCITIFDYVAWPETMVNSCNQLAKPDKEDILKKLGKKICFDPQYQPFGNGDSAGRITEKIAAFLQ